MHNISQALAGSNRQPVENAKLLTDAIASLNRTQIKILQFLEKTTQRLSSIEVGLANLSNDQNFKENRLSKNPSSSKLKISPQPRQERRSKDLHSLSQLTPLAISSQYKPYFVSTNRGTDSPQSRNREFTNKSARRSTITDNYNQFGLPIPHNILEKALPFGPYLKQCTPQSLPQRIEQWLGQVFTKLSHAVYHKFSNNQLCKDDMKMVFCNGLILNAVKFLQALNESPGGSRYWNENKLKVLSDIDQSAKKVLQFLMNKYPIKPRSAVYCPSFGSAVEEFDELDKPQSNTIYSCPCPLQYRENGNYSFEIMSVLNYYIRASRSNMENFKNSMGSMFQLSFKDIYDAYEAKGINSVIRHNSLQLTNKAQNLVCPNTAANPSNHHLTPNAQFTTLKHIIGCKIAAATETYNSQELSLKYVPIKSPQILRVIIKWIDALEKKLSAWTTDGSNIPDTLPNKKSKQLSGAQPVRLAEQEKQLLHTIIKKHYEKSKPYSHYSNSIKENIALLTKHIRKWDNEFTFLPESEVIVGLTTAITSPYICKTMTQYLESIIHCLLSAQKEFNSIRRSECVGLLSFGIYDLLRAKVSGTKYELFALYQTLERTHDVVRIKNRTDSMNRDYLINIIMRNCPVVCQLQLAIDNKEDHEDRRTQKLQCFSHFLYEIQRSKYGPLTEAIMINNHTNPAVSFFEDALKKSRVKVQVKGLKYNSITKMWEADGCRSFQPNESFSCGRCLHVIHPKEGEFCLQSMCHSYDWGALCFDCLAELIRPEARVEQLVLAFNKYFQPIPSENLPQDEYQALLGSYQYLYYRKLDTSKTQKIITYKVYRVDGVNYLVPIGVHLPVAVKSTTDALMIEWYGIRKGIQIQLKNLDSIQSDQALSLIDDSIMKQIDKDSKFIGFEDEGTTYVIDIVRSPEEENPDFIKFCSELTQVFCRLRSKGSKDIRELIKDHLHNSTVQLTKEQHLLANAKYYRFNELTKLTIKNTPLEEFDLSLLKTCKLMSIDLSFTHLSKLHAKQCEFPVLNSLLLSNNRLDELEFPDSTFRWLLIINLSNNQFKNVPGMLKQGNVARKLQSVYLDFNRIKKLNFAEQKLQCKNLSLLSLKFNRLESVVGFSECPVRLGVLNLDNNFLKRINFEEQEFVLKELRLSSNFLECLNGVTAKSFTKLQTLDLRYNPLRMFDSTKFIQSPLAELNLYYTFIGQLDIEDTHEKTLKYVAVNPHTKIKVKELDFKYKLEKQNIVPDSEECLDLMNWMARIGIGREYSPSDVDYESDMLEEEMEGPQLRIVRLNREPSFYELRVNRKVVKKTGQLRSVLSSPH